MHKEAFADTIGNMADSAKDGIGAVGDRLGDVDPKMLTTLLASGAGAGLLGGYLTSQGRERRGESRGARRRRILRNALLAAGAGAGTVGLGMYGARQLGTALPEDDKDPTSSFFSSPGMRLGYGGAGFLAADGVAAGKGPQGGRAKSLLARLNVPGYDKGMSNLEARNLLRSFEGAKDIGNLNRATSQELMRAGASPTRMGKPEVLNTTAFPRLGDWWNKLKGTSAGQAVKSKSPSWLGKGLGKVTPSMGYAGSRKLGLGVAAGGLLIPEILGAGKALGGLTIQNPVKGD